MVDSVPYSDFCIQTRPEIRKGCVWDVGLLFSLEALEKHKLKEIYLEKPRVQRESGAYLCLKVRSKLIQKEIGFGKVGELEHDRPYIEPNSMTGSATLKVKFMQRPRAVFHKHADVMVLVISLRSCTTNEVILTAEHELIFRGGTGSMHSADSRKKNSGPSASLSSPASSNHHHSHHGHHAVSSGHHHHPHHHSALSHASHQSSLKSVPTASHTWDDLAASSYNSHHLPDHLSSGSQHSIHSSLTNGVPGQAKTTRSNRGALSLITASSSLPLPSPFAKPSLSHIALSDAVTRAHPQSASLFPVSTKTSSASSTLLSTSDDPLSDSSLFFQGNGTFFFDSNSEPSENQPHMEVQPLTLATIQEFQLGLQEQTSILPKSCDSNATEEYDMGNSLSPTAGLTEESTTELDDARELEAWAKSYGIDTSIFTPGTSSLDAVPSDANSFPSMHQEALIMTDTNFLPSDAMAFNSNILPTHTEETPVTIKQEVSMFHNPESREAMESYPQAENGSENNQEVQATVAAETSASAPAVQGAITRGRAARIRGESNQGARKRRAGFEPDDMPCSKMPCFNSSSHPMNHLADCMNPAQGGSFEDKVFQKLFFRSLTFLSLEELRALAQSAPLPIFVKDEQGSYLLANPAFCSFIYDDSWDAIANRSAEELLEAEESEPIHRADEYIKAREGNIGTFYLSVKHQDYKVMKLYTKLRDCDQKLVVGAVTF